MKWHWICQFGVQGEAGAGDIYFDVTEVLMERTAGGLEVMSPGEEAWLEKRSGWRTEPWVPRHSEDTEGKWVQDRDQEESQEGEASKAISEQARALELWGSHLYDFKCSTSCGWHCWWVCTSRSSGLDHSASSVAILWGQVHSLTHWSLWHLLALVSHFVNILMHLLHIFEATGFTDDFHSPGIDSPGCLDSECGSGAWSPGRLWAFLTCQPSYLSPRSYTVGQSWIT